MCAVSAASPVLAGPLLDAESGPLGNAPLPRIALDDNWLPSVPASLNEQVIRIPVGASPGAASNADPVTLANDDLQARRRGPVPDDRVQSRQDARQPPQPGAQRTGAVRAGFVRRGYVVVAPNRRGFGASGGTYEQDGCDVAMNGMGQAADIAATIDYMSTLPYVDARHIAVAGTSHGGLAAIAYGAQASVGVRALINFSGGLRQDACDNWQDNLTQAFDVYGEKAHVPSLWLYGDNDSIWTPALIARMYAAYRQHGAGATMVDFGVYKNDAHRLVGDRDGVRVWWPAVEAFLAARRHAHRRSVPGRRPGDAATERLCGSRCGRVGPVCRRSRSQRLSELLHQYPSRAFAVSDTGAWSWAEGGDNPMSTAVANCQKQSATACRLYAVNETVVWREPGGTRTALNTGDAGGGPSDARDEKSALASQ